jgi:predicted RecB family nuclease
MFKNDLHISERAIRAHYWCIRKAYLVMFSPELSSPTEYENMLTTLSNINRQNYLLSLAKQSKVVEPFSSLAISKGADIITDVNLSVDLLSISDATLAKVVNVICPDEPLYEPIIFSSEHKIQTVDKVELSFIGYTLSKFFNYLPDTGHVVLVDGRAITVKLSENIKKCQPSITLLQELITQPCVLPPVCLNKHCPYCEFQNVCKESAIQEDSLSLLGGITKKQILKFEKKGIFTVKQLSFLYRPRKRGRRSRLERVAHKYELQALALRTGNNYIQDKPIEIPKHEVEIFIDFECIPDESFFYLFGVVVYQADKQDNFQFWANTKNDEESAWKDFISVIEQYGNCPLFHYGSFENKAILKLGERFGTPTKTIIERLLNVNTYIYGRLYFPVYSNSLKDICNYLGLSWSSPNASGLQSIVWRHEYDQSKDNSYRELLQTYNLEDCQNLKGLTDHLRLIAADAAHSEHVRFADKEGGSMPESASNLSKQLSNILLSAYGAYEQKKITLKNKGNVTTLTNDSSDNKKKRPISQSRKVNKIIHVRRGRTCPNHPGRKLKPTQIEAKQTIFDLKFTSRGVKKEITQYIGMKGRCYICQHSFSPPQIRKLGAGNMYGHGFIAWVSYQRLAMRLPLNKIVQLVEDSFGE